MKPALHYFYNNVIFVFVGEKKNLTENTLYLSVVVL